MGDERVRIVEHDPAWLQRFHDQRAILIDDLQPWQRGPIEHVGSTAVTGLAAKPIIDIAVPVTSLAAACDAIPVLQRAGWRYWPSDPNGDWRLWFLRPVPEARTHHLYLIQYDDQHLQELLAFRDRLRSDEPTRRRYEHLKRFLSAAHRGDREAYTAAKTDFVTQTLRYAGMAPEPRRRERDGAVTVHVAVADTLDDPALRRLIAHAAGDHRDRIDDAIHRHRRDPDTSLLVARDADAVVGVVGYHRNTDASQATILHLAVDPGARRRGIGRTLLAEVVGLVGSPTPSLIAETDDDAVAFYEAVGFTATTLGEIYPGVRRYRVSRPGAGQAPRH